MTNSPAVYSAVQPAVETREEHIRTSTETIYEEEYDMNCVAPRHRREDAKLLDAPTVERQQAKNGRVRERTDQRAVYQHDMYTWQLRQKQSPRRAKTSMLTHRCDRSHRNIASDSRMA